MTKLCLLTLLAMAMFFAPSFVTAQVDAEVEAEVEAEGQPQEGAQAPRPQGAEHLDEAMRLRVAANDIRDLYGVIEELEKAIEAGLSVEDAEFAEQMLSTALMERASMLARALDNGQLPAMQRQRVRRSAESDLRRVLAYDNPPRDARLLLAELLAEPPGDRHEARRQLSAYLESEELADDERAEALMLRGRVQSSFEKALADFDAAIKLAPGEVQYRLTRVLLLRAQKRWDDALESLEAIIAEGQEPAVALMVKGEILREQEKFPEALEVFAKVHELAPEELSPLQHRGEIYRELQEYEKAIAEFTAILEQKPDALLPRIHRAEARQRAGKTEEALADVNELLEVRADFIPAIRLKAEILAQQDKLQEAIAALQAYSGQGPQTVELSLQLALYHLIAKQPAQAIEAYSQALIADPDNFMALRGRGDAYLNVGDHHAARADFQRALEVKDDDPELLNNFAWLLATSPDEDIRDGARAIELATKASEATNYEQAHVLSTLAAAYAETGDFEAAQKWSQKAVDKNDPTHGPQLAEELESYRQQKPWRERQNAGSKEPTPSSTDQRAEDTANADDPPTADDAASSDETSEPENQAPVAETE